MGFFKNFVKALTNPVTLVSAAATFLIPGAAAFTLSAFATRVAISAALTSTLQTLTPKPKLPSFSDFSSQTQNRTQLIKQPTVPRRIIYGETRISGVLGFAETSSDNEYLHLVVLLATHEVNQIGTVYINEQALTLDGSGNVTAPSQFANLVRVNKHLGSDGQNADSDLVAESSKWTNDHKLSGIAYVYVRLKFDADAFPNGLPNISALVQGKKVFDPRTSTTAYSTNPALCIRDYLTDSKYGFGASSSEIDDTSFTTAANICEESVSLNAGGTENKYTMNGTIESNATPKQTLENLLTSMGGIVIYSNGTFKIKAAKYVSPSVTLDEGDVRGAIGLQTNRSRRDNYNAVKGVFVSPTNNYIAADYPAFTSSTFETEDGGDQVFLDMDLPYTTSASMAQRLSKIALFRNRQKVSMTMNCSLKAFQLDVGDVVSINNTRFGFSAKTFEVAEWGLAINSDENNTNLTVDLTLREINSAVYDWTPGVDEKVFQLDNTTLTNPFVVQSPVMTISDELRALNEEAISVLIVDVSSTDEFVVDFEVQAKKTTDTNYINLGKASGSRFELVNVEDNAIYDVRARSITRFSRSSFSTVQHQVVGKAAPPQDVSDFSVNIINTEAHLSWTPVTDLDLSHYRIRHCRETTGGTYANAVDLADKVSRPANTVIVPAMTGTYFIKAVDKLGNSSLNATSKVAIIEDIKGLNAVATSTQHPSFSGTKTNLVVVDNKLQLNTSINFDSLSGNFDDALGLFDGGGGNIASSGSYEFDTYVDLSAVFTSRVTANLNVTRIDYVDLFDAAQGNFDDRAGEFDGDPQEFDDVNTELLVATTEDDPSGSATYTDFRKFFVGDYKARAFKFKVNMTSTDPEATHQISALSVKIDMPDRVFSETDIASGTDTAGKSITFSPAFKAIQGIGISASNLTSGDYYVITNKSATGFTIEFFNSSDATIDRTFDYVVKGYGELAS